MTCTNETDKGRKTDIVSTTGHSTVKENIIAIFGAKQVCKLLYLLYICNFGEIFDNSFNEKILVDKCNVGVSEFESGTDLQYMLLL